MKSTKPLHLGLAHLIINNIGGAAFRSWVALLCAALMAAFAVTGTVILGGAQDSLQKVLDRLGADIIVIPAGGRGKMENAFLMGVPANLWMPDDHLKTIAQIPGVTAVSPQLFLATLRGATCCVVPEMFMVAFDPQTDFTLRPWLSQHIPGGLKLGEALGGSWVFVPDGQAKILIYGYSIDLQGNLQPTGTGLDQTLFFTFETAREISRLSEFQAEKKLSIPDNAVSSIMVKVSPQGEPHQVAQEISKAIPTVDPVESSTLFRSQRDQLNNLTRSMAALLALTWIMSSVLIGLVFSMVINERKREVGVLRALGAQRLTILGSLLAEALALALFGGVAGIGIALFGVSFFRSIIIEWIGIPFITPTFSGLATLFLEGVGMAVLTVIPAALIPSLRISWLDPSIAMRK